MVADTPKTAVEETVAAVDDDDVVGDLDSHQLDIFFMLATLDAHNVCLSRVCLFFFVCVCAGSHIYIE